MNKKCFFLLHMLGIALITGACGAVEDTTETVTEYVSKGYSVESGTTGTQQTEEAFSFSNKVLGNLTEQSVKLIKNAVVYVKPDKNSAQLGTLEKGTKVKAVGKTEKDEWLMVNYNGRVAYIKSNSIDRDELSSVEETVEEDGSDSRGHGGTANGNNSDTNSGGTGSTVKKPSNTNSGNGTITPTKPDTPVTPTKPDTPITPTEPDAPVTPTEPDTPITPSEPDTSVTPTEPDNPVTPPTESDNSSESEESLDGE